MNILLRVVCTTHKKNDNANLITRYRTLKQNIDLFYVLTVLEIRMRNLKDGSYTQ